MYMLIAVLCLQTGATDAECRREARGPYLARAACVEVGRPLLTMLARWLSSSASGAKKAAIFNTRTTP